MAIGALGAPAVPSLQSLLTMITPDEDLGQVLAALTIVEGVVLAIRNPLLFAVYEETLQTADGTVWWLAAVSHDLLPRGAAYFLYKRSSVDDFLTAFLFPSYSCSLVSALSCHRSSSHRAALSPRLELPKSCHKSEIWTEFPCILNLDIFERPTFGKASIVVAM